MSTLVYPPIDPEVEPWISATQISTFELCNRKWAWRHIERVYAEPNKFAQLGVDTHGELEGWLREARVPSSLGKEGLLAQAMIPYLPPPQAVDPKNVERDELIVVQDVLFNIKVDLFMPWQVSWDGVTRPRTYDHKTSGDPARWAPKPDQIQYDPQAALYAAWTIIVTQQTEIDLQWNYVKTKGAIVVHPVCATVTDEMITPRMLANVETGRAIKEHIKNTKRALDVVHDPRACDEYGGCPYRERCGISPKERIVSIMSDFKNQPATQQFLQGVGPNNGAAVNPPQFQQPPAFQQPAQGVPQFQPQAQQAPPQFQAPPGQQFAAPIPQQAPVQFQQPPPQMPPQASAVPQFNPSTQPQWQAPQQSVQQPPWQAPAAAPQPPPAQQFIPPQQVTQQTAPVAEKGPGRPKQSKEYDGTGAWAIFMGSAIQLTGGNVGQAAQIADQALQELKARQ
jgi:hypothetical protein